MCYLVVKRSKRTNFKIIATPPKCDKGFFYCFYQTHQLIVKSVAIFQTPSIVAIYCCLYKYKRLIHVTNSLKFILFHFAAGIVQTERLTLEKLENQLVVLQLTSQG